MAKNDTDLLAGITEEGAGEVFDLLDEIDEGDDSEAWRPEPGDGVQGTVTARRSTTSKFTTEPIPVVVLKTPTGKSVRITGYQSVLRNEINEIDPQPGDLFGCKYFGKKDTKDGTGSYHHFKAAGRKATVTTGTTAKAPF